MAKPFWILVITTLASLGLWQFNANADFDVDNAILATGMKPQLELIREAASDNGWLVTCEGKSGRLTVLRIVPGLLPWKASEEELQRKIALLAASVRNAPRISTEASCDLPADHHEMVLTNLDENIILGIGRPETLEPLIKIAADCEVVGARLTDGPPAKQHIYEGEIPADWVGFEIDPSLNQETGPLSCLIMLSQLELYREDLDEEQNPL